MTSILAQRPITDRSFERLYRAYIQDVYRYSLMLLRNRADAEDAAQTTFMKAYRAILRGDRPRHPRRWLITIAHNTCRTRARDNGRRPQEVAFDERLADPATTPDEDVDVDELVRALGVLSFNQRAALVMRELEGRSYAEIAATLGVSGSAVETLLFRARRALREQLEGSLTCGEAERALSLQSDGRLDADGRVRLRAHLRECSECASLARRHRARRAALRSLGPVPLPASLASWGGVGAGSGIAAKVAAVIAAGVAAAGVTTAGEAVMKERALPPVAPPAVAAASAAAPTVGVSAVATAAQRTRPALAVRRPLRSRTALVLDAPAPVPGAAPPPTAVPATPSPPGATPVAAPAAAVPAAPAVALPIAQPSAPVAVEATPPVTASAGPVAVSLPPATVELSPPPLPVELPPPPPLPVEPPPLPTLP